MKTLMIDSLVGNEYAACLCQGLHDAGVDVELIATEDREIADHYTFTVSKIAPSKEEDKNKAFKLIKYFQYLILIVWLAKRKRANAVHFQFFRRERMESLLFPIMRLLGIYLVHTAHNVLPHEHSRIDYYFKYLVYRSSNAIIVHSQYIKDKLLRMFKVDPDKIAVIPHGNFDVYLPKEKITQVEAREKLSLDQATPILLFFGYIREYKGVGHLLETFDQAADEVPDVKLIVAGNPHTEELGERYQKQIEGMRHKDRVIYVPMFIPTEDVALYFSAADAVTLPYKHIDHSGIVHMAYSFGKPVIALVKWIIAHPAATLIHQDSLKIIS
ncbi:MAG: glycosyltransferase, partial [Chloroflexota bacterium]